MLLLKCHESWELSGVAADRAHTNQSAFLVSLLLRARTAGARMKAGSPPNMAAPLPLRHCRAERRWHITSVTAAHTVL